MAQEPPSLEDRVRSALSRLPAGEVVTYAEFAMLVGLDSSKRAPIVVSTVLNRVADASTGARLPWWRVIRSGDGQPVDKRLQSKRPKEQLCRLRVELSGAQLAEPLPREQNGRLPPCLRPLTEDVEVAPTGAHTHTFIYLHGFGNFGARYLRTNLHLPWGPGSAWPGLRVVLPTAPRTRQPWGEWLNGWHGYVDRVNHTVGDAATLARTRARIDKVMLREAKRVRGGFSHIFLGGCSQGCAVALDAYMRHRGPALGGFAGVAGFVPRDADGFQGADAALAAAVARAQGSAEAPPVWLLNGTDDKVVLPEFVERSLRGIRQLPGLKAQRAQGCGHGLGLHEGKFLETFLESATRGSVSKSSLRKRPACSRKDGHIEPAMKKRKP